MIVPRVRTPLTELELARCLRDGHVRAFDELPDPDRLGCSWAQCALEHARGRAIDNNCVGNVTAGSTWKGDVYELRVSERVKRDPDVWKVLTLRFRSHSNPIDGAADYWRLLARRFASVLPLFDDGDARGAALRLSELGYYTALSGPYATAMVELLARYRRIVGPALAADVPALTDGEQAAIAEVADRVVRMADDARAGVEGMLAFERRWPPRHEAPALP